MSLYCSLFILYLMKKLIVFKHLYVQILLSILVGILLGHFYPNLAVKMKPLGDGFIKLIRAFVPFIIFTTVILGINQLKNVKELGRIGIKAFIYFEVMTTIAMLLGLIVAHVFQPGAHLNFNINALDNKGLTPFLENTSAFHLETFLLNIIPNTLMSAFIQGEPLQVLLIAILIGIANLQASEQSKKIVNVLECFSAILFKIIHWIMKIAPIAAFGAISYTVGTYGIHSLTALGKLLICFYVACGFFIFVILNLIAKISKFSLIHFIKYIKDELLIVLGTATTETVLPSMITKLEKYGCPKPVAAFVLPTGYAFNLDGMSIYLTLAFIFIAQAFHIEISIGQQIIMLITFMFMSKGAANVTGGGFIVLATVITSTHMIPVEGLALLLGIDRLMSCARSLTNLLGNSVATIFISKWENKFKSEIVPQKKEILA